MAGFWRSSKGLFEIGADPIEAGRGFFPEKVQKPCLLLQSG
jgi:hypothetical protein